MDSHVAVREAERKLSSVFAYIDDIVYENQDRVLSVFRSHRVRESHFIPTSGYGYNDAGRDMIEDIFAEIMGTEDALVRPGIVSGTHALALCLNALLEPGDELVAVTGPPYDTLQRVIGQGQENGSTLTARGIKYKELPLTGAGAVDRERLPNFLGENTRVVLIQRSRGYALRPALGVDEIGEATALVHRVNPGAVVLVDNCYGEFVEAREPGAAGADLVAGSLIKNPGGGLAPGGGYVAGRRDLVQAVAERWTAPGLGKEIGPSLTGNRLFFQGLFLAPTVVGHALKGAALAAQVFAMLGYQVDPQPEAARHDIVQALVMGSADRVLKVCQTVQSMSPVDSDVTLEYGAMPGYEDSIVMAAGTFVQGSSIELSCDAPMRPPYVAYWQGGLTYAHARRVVRELHAVFSD